MSGASKKQRIGIIGCGNMGSCFAKHLSDLHHLYLYDRNPEKTKELSAQTGAAIAASAADLVDQAELIILAIKPQDLNQAAAEIKGKLNSGHLLVSILAGVSTATLKQAFGTIPLIRMMPNMAIRYGEGVIGLADSDPLSEEKRKLIDGVFLPLGMLLWLPEDKMDALTALTGSGPAFAFVMIESMVDSAVAMGFPASKALPLVLQMLKGSIALIENTHQHPAELKWQVSSPSGTTIEGLKRLEQEGVRSGIIQTFLAAFARAKQLSAKIIDS